MHLNLKNSKTKIKRSPSFRWSTHCVLAPFHASYAPLCTSCCSPLHASYCFFLHVFIFFCLLLFSSSHLLFFFVVLVVIPLFALIVAPLFKCCCSLLRLVVSLLCAYCFSSSCLLLLLSSHLLLLSSSCLLLFLLLRLLPLLVLILLSRMLGNPMDIIVNKYPCILKSNIWLIYFSILLHDITSKPFSKDVVPFFALVASAPLRACCCSPFQRMLLHSLCLLLVPFSSCLLFLLFVPTTPFLTFVISSLCNSCYSFLCVCYCFSFSHLLLPPLFAFITISRLDFVMQNARISDGYYC